MLTIQKEFCTSPDGTAMVKFQINGDSTEEKPIYSTMATGSTFFEVDTEKVYFFNRRTQEWIEG